MSSPSVPKSSLYTGTGDAGESSLYTGERRAKDDAVFAALGDVDELNSLLGVAREHCGSLPLAPYLAELQSRLLDVGSAVATPPGSASEAKAARTRFPGDAVARLEASIDALDAALPPLAAFILPSGGLGATALHTARAVCRRAERAVAPLARGGDVEPPVLVFLNRLSDWLFAAARTAAKAEGREEVVYKKA